MTALARTWDQLTLPGKALLILIPLLAFLTTGLLITLGAPPTIPPGDAARDLPARRSTADAR